MTSIAKAALLPAILAASIIPADVIKPQLAQAFAIEHELRPEMLSTVALSRPTANNQQLTLETGTTLEHHRGHRRHHGQQRRRRIIRHIFH